MSIDRLIIEVSFRDVKSKEAQFQPNDKHKTRIVNSLMQAKFAIQIDFKIFFGEQYAHQINQLVGLILELEFDKLEFQPKNPNINQTWN